MNIKPVSKKQNIVIQELEKELLVYDLKTNKAFCLNETSAIIYQLCDGTKTVVNISDLMSRKLKTLVSEDFILLALNELNRDGLLEKADEINEYFAGISRRKIIKKIGFASLIALPLVSSIVAPNAANASSLSACFSPTCVTSGNTFSSPQPDAPTCLFTAAGATGCCSCQGQPLGYVPSTGRCTVICI